MFGLWLKADYGRALSHAEVMMSRNFGTSFAVQCPDLLCEVFGWDPFNVYYKSKSIMEWKCCFCGNVFATRVENRTRKWRQRLGCGKCEGSRAQDEKLKKVKLRHVFPAVFDLIVDKEKHYDILAGNNTELVEFECFHGTRYFKKITDAIREEFPCKCCSFNELNSGFNDVLSVFPQLCGFVVDKEKARNTLVTSGEELELFHVDETGCEHHWKVVPREMFHGVRETENGAVVFVECKVCTGDQLQVGVNDLATVMSELDSDIEFHKSKENKYATPKNILAYSAHKIVLQCTKHVDKYGKPKPVYIDATARGFVSGKQQCPECNRCEHGRSFGEIEVFDFIRDMVLPFLPDGTTLQHSCHDFMTKGIFELDVFLEIPIAGTRRKKRVAVEFDGDFFHVESDMMSQAKPPGYHKSKRMLCKRYNIELFQVKEYMWQEHQDEVKKVLVEFFKQWC